VEATVDAMLDQTDLRDRAGDQVQTLSGGNRQRVNIAIGLLSEPDVLLLDEPSAALDPRQRERLWEFILALAERGTTVVYSTHVVPEAERYANQVLVLADGEKLFDGSPRAFERVVAEECGEAPDFEAAFVEFLRHRGH
jgi:ABC-2 type transport system ATP-binding protein